MSDRTSRHDHDIILLKPQVDEQQRLLDSRKERVPVPLYLSFRPPFSGYPFLLDLLTNNVLSRSRPLPWLGPLPLLYLIILLWPYGPSPFS
ncbi:hypothetical protein VTJ04DRAFT_3466 [Mycothermus thermophilus]|uniref:uncharacterized protein n=1 Tax=Humicola insolens TaxID=85995 RepID=UPI00374471F1